MQAKVRAVGKGRMYWKLKTLNKKPRNLAANRNRFKYFSRFAYNKKQGRVLRTPDGV